jgi:hypothetical protein
MDAEAMERLIKLVSSWPEEGHITLVGYKDGKINHEDTQCISKTPLLDLLNKALDFENHY